MVMSTTILSRATPSPWPIGDTCDLLITKCTALSTAFQDKREINQCLTLGRIGSRSEFVFTYTINNYTNKQHRSAKHRVTPLSG